MVKTLSVNVGDTGLISRSERSPGGGNGNSLQYSFLENPMDGGAWRATVFATVTKSQTQLSDFTHSRTQLNSLILHIRTFHCEEGPANDHASSGDYQFQ